MSSEMGSCCNNVVLSAEKDTTIVFKKLQNKEIYLFCKRFFDIVVSFFALIILLIPMAIIALLIYLESPGPAVFKQHRIGKDGKSFIMYKFRTMHIDAPSEMPTSLFENSEKYITRLGVTLRKFSLDELPQFWNVLIGNMSIVGYRPLCETEIKANKLRKEYGVLQMRPGITGLAQVSGRDNITYKEKALIDAEYLAKCGFKTDLICLVKTIKIVLTREGVR